MKKLSEDIFMYPEDEYFDDLPLDVQKGFLDSIKAKHDYFLKKHATNSGKTGGRPPSYSPEMIEKIKTNVERIKKSKKYKERKEKNEKDFTAYKIYVEELIDGKFVQEHIQKYNTKMNKDTIWEIAKAFRQAVIRHEKRTTN